MHINFKVPNIALFNVEKAKKVFQDDIRRSVDEMLITAQRNIQDLAPVGDSSRLKNSITTERINMGGRVITGVDYAVVVNEGRRPGATPPPSNVLINWIRRSKSGQAWYSKMKSNYPRINEQSAAYILAKSIGKKGFKNPFFNKGVNKSRKYMKVESKKLMQILAKGLMS